MNNIAAASHYCQVARNQKLQEIFSSNIPQRNETESGNGTLHQIQTSMWYFGEEEGGSLLDEEKDANKTNSGTNTSSVFVAPMLSNTNSPTASSSANNNNSITNNHDTTNNSNKTKASITNSRLHFADFLAGHKCYDLVPGNKQNAFCTTKHKIYYPPFSICSEWQSTGVRHKLASQSSFLCID